jgi:hypothetical protein
LKIGIVTEDRQGLDILDEIIGRVPGEGHQFLRTFHAAVHPKQPSLDQMALKLARLIDQVKARGADRVLVLIDREDRECAVEFARGLSDAISRQGQQDVRVIVKDRCLENWLIADPGALTKLKGFAVTAAFSRNVRGKADAITDPTRELARMRVSKKPYHKAKDGLAIAQKLDPNTCCRNSRSFRKFWKELTGDSGAARKAG